MSQVHNDTSSFNSVPDLASDAEVEELFALCASLNLANTLMLQRFERFVAVLREHVEPDAWAPTILALEEIVNRRSNSQAALHGLTVIDGGRS